MHYYRQFYFNEQTNANALIHRILMHRPNIMQMQFLENDLTHNTNIMYIC